MTSTRDRAEQSATAATGRAASAALWVLLALSYAVTLLPPDLPGILALLAGWVPVAFALWHFSLWAGTGVALASFGVIAVVSFCAEALGVATGLVFGDYHYADGPLGPLVLGVPPLILLQYFAMGYASLLVGRALAAPVRGAGRIALATVLSAFALTALDLASDPWQSTHLGYWIWPDGGAYFGVPVHNFVGWFCEALVFFALVNLLLARRPTVDRIAVAPAALTSQGLLLYGTFPFAVIARAVLHPPTDAAAATIASAMAAVSLFAVVPLLVAALAARRRAL
jgi:uncharacterized membrane protein